MNIVIQKRQIRYVIIRCHLIPELLDVWNPEQWLPQDWLPTEHTDQYRQNDWRSNPVIFSEKEKLISWLKAKKKEEIDLGFFDKWDEGILVIRLVNIMIKDKLYQYWENLDAEKLLLPNTTKHIRK